MKQSDKETLNERDSDDVKFESLPEELSTDAEFIKRLEVCADLAGSMNALSRATGMSQSGMRRYFHGGEPTRPVLIAIANAVGVNLLWLMTGEGETFKPAKPDYLKSAAEIGREQADKYGITKTLSEQADHATRRKDINHGEPPEYAVKREQTTTKEAPLDLQLLQEVIEALEAHLMIRGMMLTPARKALFIQLIYEHQMDTRLNKDETTEKFLKLLDE
jgi:transcriptional regulator with XRE-family HTH domain